MKVRALLLAAIALPSLLGASAGSPPPRVEASEYLGPLTGADAPTDPANKDIAGTGYYGTDLGWTYQHGGKIHFLFGDTWSNENYAPVNGAASPQYDDIFGTVSLAAWPNGNLVQKGRVPTIALAMDPRTHKLRTLDPGHVMDLGKTPVGGFSDGRAEYGLFFSPKGMACHADAECPGTMKCNLSLGTAGAPLAEEAGTTLACMRGSPFCTAPAGAGLCTDPTASIAGPSDAGQVASAGMSLRFGVRSSDEPGRYVDTQDWLTTKFLNTAVRAVTRFDPAAGKWDYSEPTDPSASTRLLYFGRPSFIGVREAGRPASLYFAWSAIPRDGKWVRHYYYGLDARGKPRFGEDESRAVPVTLEGQEVDVINQMSVVWLAPAKKWMMVYGGGVSQIPNPVLPKCGLMQLFAGAECDKVAMPDQSVRVRFADQPWGPWSKAQVMLGVQGPQQGATGPYGPGQPMRHPDCTQAGCAPHSHTYNYSAKEYGFFYGANVIEPWTTVKGDEVSVVWNVSTWDPYRVVLYRTRFKLP